MPALFDAIRSASAYLDSISFQEIRGFLSLKTAAGAIALYVLGYIPLRFIYRLYFHPLSNIPGPKSQLVFDLPTRLYWFVGGGQGKIAFKADEWHQRYGPIFRIAHNAVHIKDIETFNQIYRVGTQFTKNLRYYDIEQHHEASIAIADPHKAHMRRAALHPYFNKKAVRKLEGLIQDKVTKFLDRLTDFEREGSIVQIQRGFRCFGSDVISPYCFNKCFDSLDEPNFAPRSHLAFEALLGVAGLHFAWPEAFAFTGEIFKLLGRKVTRTVNPLMADILDFQDQVKDAVFEQKETWEKTSDRTELFSALEQLYRDDPKGRWKAATDQQLLNEGFAIFNAAGDTIATALTFATYWLIKNPDLQQRLLEELKQVMPEPRSQINDETLDKLPFLQACIKESLRFSHGVPAPLPRDVPQGGADFLKYHLPEKTIIWSSSYLYHTDPETFPEPFKWCPTRWLDSSNNLRQMDNYFMPFSRGARICIGMDLAMVEMKTILARLVRRYEMQFAEGFQDEFMEWTAIVTPILKGRLTVTVKERSE
ncbi:hypothetical protein H072_604 [Dactylellina haptotyla CBS 200.50]|uniref:Cytochrome P450 n=1 Tax=Dactylellina haptotyla (strain CBS 200.50) TaxID=1284197 RepID=S8AWS3_DACHA|nr:hypothetical protein H072_604 [Dactylellina haptotyla CBS 200.50]